MKSKACFERSIFYGKDGTNGIDGEDRENRVFKEIRKGATLDRADGINEVNGIDGAGKTRI